MAAAYRLEQACDTGGAERSTICWLKPLIYVCNTRPYCRDQGIKTNWRPPEGQDVNKIMKLILPRVTE